MLLRTVVTALTPVRIVALLLFVSVHATAQSGPDTAKSIEGVWIYADDPAKKIKSDPVYEGSTITIEAGGRAPRKVHLPSSGFIVDAPRANPYRIMFL